MKSTACLLALALYDGHEHSHDDVHGRVEIYGGAFNTPALGASGALDGTATSVVISANPPLPNHQYSGCVTFYRVRTAP